MAEMTVREVQLSCLEILKAFDAFCKEHKLCYYLAGGTLLGAVRHKGFIPWDDDVDVIMPRPDYERLCRLSDEKKVAQYMLFYPGCDKIYNRPWARLTDTATQLTAEHHFEGERYGTYIDIFPIDGMPESDIGMKCHFVRMRILDALNKSAKRKFALEKERLAFIKKILYILLRPFGSVLFAKKMDRVAKAYDYTRCKKRGVAVVTFHGLRERLPADVFESSVDSLFEGLTLPAPKGWDCYLKALYGSYMQIPKEHENDSGNTFTHRVRYAAANVQEEDIR